MAEIVPLFGDRGASGGGGPEDPMLDERVTRLEDALGSIDRRLAAIDAELKHLPKATDYASLRADVAEIKGRLSSMVTSWQLFTALITTWAAGAAIVFTLVKFAPK